MGTDNSKNGRPHRIWDYHAGILRDECVLHRTRILNLLERWKGKAEEGLLPRPMKIGIFEDLTRMNVENSNKLSFFTDSNLKRWERRSFEDIIEMTDSLRDIHFALSVAERSYWQRLEGYEAAAVDAVRSVTFSETGTIQQICNAADFLCLAIWSKVFGDNKEDWRGLVTFGQFHEFRNWHSFVFAPDYVQLYNFRMWVYFTHEVMHSVVEKLLPDKIFQQIHNDLVSIFSSVLKDMKHADEEYLAKEAICDIMATLVAGEAYIQTLSSLKYYPTITVFSKAKFLSRRIRFPMLLRTIISAWTIEIAWGMHEIQSLDAKRNMVTFPLKDLIEKVALEDDIEQQRVLFFLKSKKDVLEQMLQDQQLPFAQIYPQLARVYNYEVALKRYALPSILNEIIRKNIIPRVKAFVQEDAYKLKPHQCFSQFVDERRLSAIQIMYLDPSCCQETSEASIIKTEMIKKKRDDQELAKALLQNRLRPDANPVNIIACLNLLSALEPVAMAACENAAIMSILLQTQYRERRFADLDKKSTLKPESLIRKR